MINGHKEDLEDQLESVRSKVSAADASLQETLLEDQARLQSSLDSIAQVQRIADTTRPNIIIEDNRAGEGSRAIFGTDTPQPRFSLTVARNEAGIGAVYSAGVHSPQTLQALLQHSRTPDIALPLQALQTQSTTVNNEAIQSLFDNISAEANQRTRHAPIGTLLSEVDSPDSMSLRQPVESTGSLRASVETFGDGLSRPNNDGAQDAGQDDKPF
jgi:hypothetical protein